MLFTARVALTPLTLMACPSLTTHLGATCGRMLQVTLSPVSYMKQIALACAGNNGSLPPSFVQDHYYCEAGNVGDRENRWFDEDPLWDGEGCPTNNTCCDPPNLPWFHRIVNPASIADIELRLCQDESTSNEDVSVQLFELYVY